jgi:hypothetical protein
MNITFKTAEGFTLDLSEGNYVTDGGGEKFVFTIFIKKDGAGAQCGPTVTRKEWALIEDIQAAIKKSEA